MTRIKIHISNVKLPFYPPCEVKCKLQNRVSIVIPKVPAILRGMSVVLVVLAIKVLIAPRRFPRHLIRPLKVWFVLNFLQHPMHWFSEHSTDSLCIGCSGLPFEISSRAITVISVQPEIPHLLRDNLLLSLPL